MISYGRVRTAFAFAFPLLLGVLYLVAGSFVYQNHLIQQREINRKLLLDRAALLAATVKSGYSTAQQIERNFRQILETVTQISCLRQFSVQREFPGLLQQVMSDGSLAACRIWAFSSNKDGFELVEAPGLMNNKKRAMEKAFAALIDLAEQLGDDQLRKSSGKFITGLFGENSAPDYLATQRAGLLTPVQFEGKPHYVYWQKFKHADACAGGFIAIVPDIWVEDTRYGLQRLANNLSRRTDIDMQVSFAGAPCVDRQFRPVLADSVNPDKAPGRNFVLSLHSAFSSKQIPMRKLHVEGNWWHYLDIISQDTHFYVAVSGRVNDNFHFPPNRLVPALSIFLFLWSAIFFFKLRLQGFSLGLAFKMLFFMTGMLPVLAFLYLGHGLIENSHEETVQKNIRTAGSMLDQIDEQAEETVAVAGLTIKELLARPDLHHGFAADDRESRYRAFAELKRFLQERSFHLNYLLLVSPEREPEYHVSSPEHIPNARYHLDYYTISAAALHKVLTGNNAGFQQIRLNNAQRSLLGSFGGPENPSAKDVFLSSLDRISSFQAGSAEKHVFFSSIIEEEGLIKCYLVLGLSVADTMHELIYRQLATFNRNPDSQFFCLSRDYSGGMKVLPAGHRFLGSHSGRELLKFLESAASALFKVEQRHQEEIFIYNPLFKTRQYFGGAVINLSGLNRMKDLKLLLLLAMAAMLSGTIYLLASAVSGIMIQPASRLTHVFRHIASGDYQQEFHYPFNNELGQLALATTQMIAGLKERRLLGKFVSTTFNTEVKLTHQQVSAQEIAGAVLFSDIRSFTTISESNPPEEIAALLNSHMRELVAIIHKFSGRVEQFIGDAIVAFFPGDSEAACRNAIHAAAIMMKKHREIQIERKTRNQVTYGIGIGLDYGVVMAGILHAHARSEFTLIGPARSNAEHCESASKGGIATRIMATGEVACGNQAFSPLFISHADNLFELASLENLP